MNRPPISLSRSLFVATVAWLVCSFSLTTSAVALPGMGGLAKKAKEKAAKAAGVEEPAVAGDTNVEFDDVVLELTGDRLDRVVATFQAATEARAGRPELVAKLEKVNDDRSKLWDKENESIRENDQKREDKESCYHDGYREVQDRMSREYAQNALTDPAIREKFTRVAQQYNAAAARGDSVAIKAAQKEMNSVMNPSREDSAAVRKNCGPLPPPLPAEGKLAALDKQIASISEGIRAIDEKVSQAQAKEGGMSRQQFAMAAERVQMYLVWRQSKSYKRSSTKGFTPEEIEAIEKRLEELRTALR